MNNKKNTMNNQPEKAEDLVYDIILFLKEWGLWNDISIFCNNRKYTDIIWDDDPDPSCKGFRDLEDVYVFQNVKISDYLDIDEELWPIYIINETLLSKVFIYDSYVAEWNNIGEKARKYLLDPNGGDLLLWKFDYNVETLEPILDSAEFDSEKEYRDFEDEMQDDLYQELVDCLYDETICYSGYPVVEHIKEEWRALIAKYGITKVPVYC